MTTPGRAFQVEEQGKEVEEAPDKVLYLEVDGGHLRTDEDYRETKVGRIFSSQHGIKKSFDDEQIIRRMEL